MKREISTVCTRDCYDTCALRVTLGESGEILSVKGDPRNPMTQGFTCPRGAKDHKRLGQNRVQSPSVRNKDRWEPIDWDKALDTTSEKLRQVLEEHGPQAILLLEYAGNSGLLTRSFSQRLWNALGATQTDGALCSQSGHSALALHYGSSHGVYPSEIASMDLIVFWGFNVANSSPHLWSLARKARRTQGTRIVFVDPIKSRTARDADLWIRPKPGSDVALVYGAIHCLIQDSAVDLAFIDKWTLGFEQLQKKASQWPPERVQQVTGVPQEAVKQLAQAYGTFKPSATMMGIGLQKCDRGADQIRAVSFIPALLGLHRGFFYSNSHPMSTGIISGRELTRKPIRIVSQVGLADLVQAGEFKFIYIHCMNPVLTLPNQHAFRAGLARPDVFVAVHETHWTKTAQLADLVLPAPTYFEKGDLVLPWCHNHVLLSPQIVPPVTDSRSETWLMQELARRLGLAEEWLYEDGWDAIDQALTNALGEGTLTALRAGEMLQLAQRPKDHYPTPSGKIEFYATQADELGLDPLPLQAPLEPSNGALRFITSATPKYTSTQFQELYGPIPALVTIHPDDADRLDIAEGEIVTLSNNLGSIQVRAHLSETILPGVAWSPRQSEGLDGEAQNCLMSSEPQEIGGGPRFNSTWITLEKVS